MKRQKHKHLLFLIKSASHFTRNSEEVEKNLLKSLLILLFSAEKNQKRITKYLLSLVLLLSRKRRYIRLKFVMALSK